MRVDKRRSAKPETGVLLATYRALATIRHDPNPDTGIDALLSDICQVTAGATQAPWAWVAVLRAPEEAIERLACHADARGPLGSPWEDPDDGARDTIRRAWVGQHPIVPGESCDRAPRAADPRLIGAFPIPRGGRPFAVLAAYGTHTPDAHLIAVLRDIAAAAACALDRIDRDRTHRQAHAEVARSERHFRAYFEHAPAAMAALTCDQQWLTVNAALCDLLGYTRAELLSKTWADVTMPQDPAGRLDLWRALTARAHNAMGLEHTLRHKTGRPVPVRIASRALRHDDDRADHLVLLIEALTHPKRHEDMLSRLAHILDKATGEIYMFDTQTLRFVFANAAACDNLGYSLAELQERTPTDVMVDMAHADFTQVLAPLAQGDHDVVAWRGAHRRRDGSTYPVEARFHCSIRGGESVFVAMVHDTTERDEFEARLRHQATHDALTGLPNRAFFHEILNRAMAHAARHETLMALLFLDLDGFKNVNDALGHEYGDALIQEVAIRLTTVLRQEDWITRGEDWIARQGGDEFTVLVQNVTTVHAVTRIAERILNAVRKPYRIQGHEIYLSGSVGITVYPFDDTNAEGLLRNADVAMYRAKESGKNTFQFYAADMSARIHEHRSIENGLWRALERNELVLHYQPQIALSDSALVGVEALVRWQHPERGLIPPAVFIPVAEESALCVPIGEWVLRTACRQSQIWRSQGHPPLRMAVNLSGRQFSERGLPALVAGILAESDLADRPQLLELEVTESMLMADTEKTAATLAALHAMGVRLAIDDFGTGYSSLSYLKRFRINTLKIDRSFVSDITSEADGRIASLVVTLGHSLGLTVIAEGVENPEQVAFLKRTGCDELQGYYFSPPLPPEGIEAWLRRPPAPHGVRATSR